MEKLNVDGTEIQVLQIEEDDYISLTDMVRKIDNGPALIEKWLRNKNTIEFLGIWEEMYNEDFDIHAYEEIMQEAGLNRFIMSVKQWVTRTNSRGIIAKAGRYGGTTPTLKGNIRDYASINELICLSNMENINAVLIEQGLSQGERLVRLNQIAIHQMSVLESEDSSTRKLLK